jgi:hypothetical protein
MLLNLVFLYLKLSSTRHLPIPHYISHHPQHWASLYCLTKACGSYFECLQPYQVSSLSWLWEYLHHKHWQTLQIRTLFLPGEPVVRTTSVYQWSNLEATFPFLLQNVKGKKMILFVKQKKACSQTWWFTPAIPGWDRRIES